MRPVLGEFRPVWNIKLMLLSIIDLMKWKLGNQLGLFRSSASGLADVRPLAAGQARIPRALPLLAAARQKKTPGSASLAGGASPSPEVYTPRLAMHISSARRMRTQLAGAEVDSEPARMAAIAPIPTTVAGIIMHARSAMGPRRPARTPPCAYGDVGVTRSVKISLIISLLIRTDFPISPRF